MKKAQRRVPRKIGGDEDDEQNGASKPNDSTPTAARPNSSVVKRPQASKSANRASIKLPHRLPLSDASRQNGTGSSLYTAEALSELKNSTPQAHLHNPNSESVSDQQEQGDEVDIISKFGPSASLEPQTSTALISNDAGSLIPTDAEIREKKERRRRLRLEQEARGKEDDFISLNSSSHKPIRRASDASSRSSDSGDDRATKNQGSLIIPAEEFDPQDKWGRQESRLQHEDEDIAEGFDDFVEDSGRVTLNKKGRREQDAARRKEMAEQIQRAERVGGSDSSSDEEGENEEDAGTQEEKRRIAAYEAAQTKAGTYGSRHTDTHSRQREKEAYERLRRRLEIPTKLPKIPEPQEIIARFKAMLQEKQDIVKEAERKLQALDREKQELVDEEERVKTLLDEAASRFEKVRAELPVEQTTNGGLEEQGRGLESLGGLSTQAVPQNRSPSPAAPVQASAPAVPSGMAGRPAQDDDDYY